MSRTIDGDKLIAYLDAWAETMPTAKARWAVQWSARAVGMALTDPGHLDRLPGTIAGDGAK